MISIKPTGGHGTKQHLVRNEGIETKLPKLLASGTKTQDKIDMIDEESRIMPVTGGGFEQGYIAQVAVDTTSMLILYYLGMQRQGVGGAGA